MSITRRNIFNHMNPFSLVAHDPFFRSFEKDFMFPEVSSLPALDLIEKEDSFLVKANVPGYTKDQISLDIEGNNLVLKGQTTEEKIDESDYYHHNERSFRSFHRSIPLSKQIDLEKVKANLKDGVLQVMIPKDQIKSEKAKIEIN